MSHISDDVVSYAHDEPLQYVGLDGVREVCKRGLDAASGAVGWDVPDLEILVREDIAVAWGLNRMHAQQPVGEIAESWSRGTRVFHRSGGEWVMIHQHVSYPLRPGDWRGEDQPPSGRAAEARPIVQTGPGPPGMGSAASAAARPDRPSRSRNAQRTRGPRAAVSDLADPRVQGPPAAPSGEERQTDTSSLPVSKNAGVRADAVLTPAAVEDEAPRVFCPGAAVAGRRGDAVSRSVAA